jgi:hypothetical protein
MHHMEDQTRRRIVNIVLIGAIGSAGMIVLAAVYIARVPPPAPAPVIVEAPPPVVPPPAPRPVLAPVIPEAQPAPVVVAPPPQPVVVAPPVVRPVPAPVPTFVAEPDARAALAYVGADPAAERVWMQAINDTTNLAPNDRKNLIEDLNETGFNDPNNLTVADLPLINNRLDIIDALYWDAADDTNVAAFDEAYKDLLNMRAQLMRL